VIFWNDAFLEEIFGSFPIVPDLGDGHLLLVQILELDFALDLQGG
jgi:hypothetical protein